MIKVKDGYAKLIGTEYKGNGSRLLVTNGADVGYSSESIANNIVQRNANQHVFATYYQSNISDEAISSIGSIYVRNTSDNYIRRVSKAQFYTVLGEKFVTLDTAQTISGSKTFSQQIKSTVDTTKPPFIINSNKCVQNLNADLLDNWQLVDIVKSGFITCGVQGLSSYWGKMWDTTVTSNYNDVDITLYVHSVYMQQWGIIGIRARLNKSEDARSMNVSLSGIVGNLPPDRFRLYYNVSSGLCQLWCNVNVRYGVYNYIVLSKTNRSTVELANNGNFYSSNFTTAQSLPSDEYADLEYIGIRNNSATSTKLQTARTINGTAFDGTQNITTAIWGSTRTISLTGAVTGSVSTNGGTNITISTSYGDMSSLNSRFVNVTGDTMTGPLKFNGDTGIGFNSTNIEGANNIGTTIKIHVGQDGASQDKANLRIGSWYGVGWYPTIENHTVAKGKHAMWLNVRNGNLNIVGTFEAGGNVVTRSRAIAQRGGRTDKVALFQSNAENQGGIVLTDKTNTEHILYLTTSNLTWKGRKVWDSGNDGAGSGLDADLLDGLDGSNYIRRWNGGYQRYSKVLKFTREQEKGWMRLSIYTSSNVVCGEGGEYIIGWNYNTENLEVVECLYARGNRASSLLITKEAANTYTIWFDNVKAGGKPNFVLLGYIHAQKFEYFTGIAQADAPENVTYTAGYSTSLYIYSQSGPYITQHTGNNINYPIVWSNQNNTNSGFNGTLYKSHDKLWFNPSTFKLYAAGGFVGNADSATKALSADKLTTSRTLWGQPFDGTQNVTGNITVNGNILNVSVIQSKDDEYVDIKSPNHGIAFYSKGSLKAVIENSGNFGIGTSSPSQKLHVVGKALSDGYMKNGSSDSYVLLGGGGHKALSNLANATDLSKYVPLTQPNTIYTSGTTPYNYVYLFRIANSSGYSTAMADIEIKARYGRIRLWVDIRTPEHPYGDGDEIYITKEPWSNNWSSRRIWYKRTQVTSGYNYYDVYLECGAWNNGQYGIVQKGGLGLIYEPKGQNLDSLPSGCTEVQYRSIDATNSGKVANSLVLKFNSGTTEGTNLYTFNGSSGKTIDIRPGSNVQFATTSGTVVISSTNTTYSQATSSTLGLVKIGYPESGKNYPVELNSSGQMYVNVPWTDKNTTYINGTGIELANTTISLKKATSNSIGGVKISEVEITSQTSNNAVTRASSSRIYPIQYAKPKGVADTRILSVFVPWINTTYNIVTASKNGLIGKDSPLVNLAGDTKDAGNQDTIVVCGQDGSLDYSSIEASKIALINKSNVWSVYQDFKAGAGNSGSDMRFKKEVEPVTSISESIAKLDIIQYIWEHPDEERIRNTFGVKADQLLELGGIFATMVHSRGDEYKTKWVEYDRFGVLAIKAIQELCQTIQQMKNRIEILENKICLNSI